MQEKTSTTGSLLVQLNLFLHDFITVVLSATPGKVTPGYSGENEPTFYVYATTRY